MSGFLAIVPCQHDDPDGNRCEADVGMLVLCEPGEPMTRDYPGSAAQWVVLDRPPCSNRCLLTTEEISRMEQWAIGQAQSEVSV